MGVTTRPHVQVIESKTPIAFSYGLLASRSTIALSTELLERMNDDELRVVLAFELHRLKSQATASATAASALVGLISWFAQAIDEVVFLKFLFKYSSRARKQRGWLLRHGGVSVGPMTLLVSPIVALLVRLSVSRKAIFDSDRAAAELVGDASLVARTLWKLDSYTKTRPFPVNLAEAHLFMVSPLTRYPNWRFASAQPPIERRLFELTGHEPL